MNKNFWDVFNIKPYKYKPMFNIILEEDESKFIPKKNDVLKVVGFSLKNEIPIMTQHDEWDNPIYSEQKGEQQYDEWDNPIYSGPTPPPPIQKDVIKPSTIQSNSKPNFMDELTEKMKKNTLKKTVTKNYNDMTDDEKILNTEPKTIVDEFKLKLKKGLGLKKTVTQNYMIMTPEEQKKHENKMAIIREVKTPVDELNKLFSLKKSVKLRKTPTK